jgi:hypothetical protein
MKVTEKNGHKVSAVKVEQTSNGTLTVHLHCCDNPTTEHRHTLYQLHKLSPEDLKKELADIGAIVAEQHASMEAAHKFITETFVEHESRTSRPHDGVEMSSTYRFYQEADTIELKRIFESQGLPVYLPVPGEDPSVAVAVVEEEDGKMKRALILKASLEAHFITPDEDPYALNRLTQIAEGAVMQMNMELARLKFPVFIDGRARVPKFMDKLINFMKKRLGFVAETDQFIGLCKRLGQ